MAIAVNVKGDEVKSPRRTGNLKLPYVKFLYKVALMIIFAVVAIAAWLIITVISNSSAMSSVNSNEYQAVFLTTTFPCS